MAYPVFPTAPRRFSEIWRLANASRSGGQTIGGAQQFVASPGGRWVAKLSLHLKETTHYLEARGFLASLDGQYSPFLVGPVDWRGQPWNVDIAGSIITPGKAAEAARQDPAYQTNPDTTGSLDFVLAVAGSMNSTTVRIQRNRGGFLRRGQYFQVGNRLHTIVELLSPEVVAVDGRAGSGAVDVRIRPWLRADYPSGTVVNFETPSCLMRLSSSDQGGVEMTTSPMSDITLDLVEAFDSGSAA